MTDSSPDAVMVAASGPSFRPLEVTVHALKLVPPAQPTKTGPFYLSNIDQMLVEPVDTFFVYLPTENRSSEGVFSVVEDALGKLLVPYHFMAGRFEVEDDDGNSCERLQVNCNGAGAAFVVATSEQTIADVGDWKVMNPEFRKLVPKHPDVHVRLVDNFLLMVQVTRFRCGGFTVGIRMSHAMFDGWSSIHFFRTFCALSRGAPPPSFPALDRTILKPRHPPTPEFDHPECFKRSAISTIPGNSTTTTNNNNNNNNITVTNLEMTPMYVTKHIALSKAEIQRLKGIALEDGSAGHCSSFEATIAQFWRARTRSLEFGEGEESKVLIAVDFRAKMEPRIAPDFCGNTIISAHVSAAAAEVARSPLSFCVAKIQEAVARIDERYVRSELDWLQLHGGGAPAIGSPKDVLVSAWWKIPFYEHDFGWGTPVHAGPPLHGTTEYALIVSNGRDDRGLLLLVSFQQHEMLKFEQHIKDM